MGSIQILVPISSSALAGSQLSLLRLIESSPARHVRFSCWVFEDGPLLSELERREIPFRRFPSSAVSTPWGLAGLLKQMPRERPDVVYLHASRALAWLARLARIPCLERVNMPRAPGAGGWCRFRWIDRLASNLNAGLLPVSEALAEQLIARGVHRDKVIVFRDLIYPDHFRRPELRARAREELNIPPEARMILGVGRLVPQKAPLDFARVAYRVCAERPNDRFVWIGDGPTASTMKAEAAACGAQFQLLPFREDIASVFAAADIYLQTSCWEGLANVVLEAMAAGLAIVATDVDGTAEALSEYPPGRLVPAGDAEAMTDALLGEAAFGPGDRDVPFPEKFTADAVCSHFVKIVSQVAQKSRKH